MSKINKTLELLYLQLLSIITFDRMRFLEKKPSSCSDALSGTESLLEQCITNSHRNLACILGTYEVLIFEKEARKKLKQIIKENIGNSLFCLMVTNQGILTIVNGEMEYLHYTDVILIYNMLQASEGLSLSESWVPIGLPGVSDSGYFQMYSNFYSLENDSISVGLLFLTEKQESDNFMNFSKQAEEIMNCCYKNKIFSLGNEDGTDSTHSKLKISLDILNKNKKSKDELISNNNDELFDNFLTKLSYNFTKLNNTYELFEEFEFLSVRHKTLNQSYIKGFNSIDCLSKYEREIMNDIYNLFDDYQTRKDIKTMFFRILTKKTHQICAFEAEQFIIFGSVSVFKEMEDIHNLLSDVAKQIKINLGQYFIL